MTRMASLTTTISRSRLKLRQQQADPASIELSRLKYCGTHQRFEINLLEPAAIGCHTPSLTACCLRLTHHAIGDFIFLVPHSNRKQRTLGSFMCYVLRKRSYPNKLIHPPRSRPAIINAVHANLLNSNLRLPSWDPILCPITPQWHFVTHHIIDNWTFLVPDPMLTQQQPVTPHGAPLA